MASDNLVPACFQNKQALEYAENQPYHEYQILYLILRHLFEECSSMQKFDEIPRQYVKKFRHLKKISFPVTFSGLKKLVKFNKHLPLVINVFCHHETSITNLGIISNQKKEPIEKKRVLYLLMLTKNPSPKTLDPVFQKGNEPCHEQVHYFYKILNVRKLLNFRRWKICSNPKKNNNFQKHFYCETCFLRFRSSFKKEKHLKTCGKKQLETYPCQDDVLLFTHRSNLEKVPVVGFCDFESVLQRRCERQHCAKCNKEECECNVSVSQDLDDHRPVGYSILFVDKEDRVFFQEEYAGTDSVHHFFKRLPTYESIVHQRRQSFQRRIKASWKDWEAYERAEVCHICSRPFINTHNGKKVLDHDHATGEIVGAAHSICNLQRQPPYWTPIYFHNAQG